MLELSQTQARHLQLAAQGLLLAPERAATRLSLRRCLERMQLLQIDTIHVVARSPYVVLFSRLGSYPVQWLDQALASAALFETWAHEACFAPIEHLALHRSYNQQTRRHWGIARGEESHEKQRAQLDALLAHIAANGPVKSSDFERGDGQSGGWWGWKDEKRWLEALFAKGELMVARRENFQRVYDLAHRVCPAIKTMALPAAAQVHGRFIEKAILALGVTQARWVHDYFRLKPRLKDADLDALVEQGLVRRVQVQGWSVAGYVHAAHAGLLKRALAGKLSATHTTLLSPFDPLVWDRERAAVMFGFDYRIECYTPQAKRTYGYFVLPILHRGQLIGRLDAKAHRALGVFEVKALFLEPAIEINDASVVELAQALTRCAVWHGTPQVKVTRTAPPALRARLRQALSPLSPGA
ncbi:MAG: crosslink repair DNA glycosylase YcaQ family protein [Rhodoferax sp.]|uniref:winged helix-turn-helix domain-containing protein n=1 Tax=Rhodoferax sp. TaxID=50421 RepID=UPI00261A960E|nr:crosslink repair DNA glycosylase YcaQ family protein [Rhodoferax sp.]MDD5332460.1 crosslink repair DNA glycosylase YcaQ family protein [Rhodoferax sp.]